MDLRLGYLGFEVRDSAAWRDFARDVLGLMIVDERSDGGFALRMDEHARRFMIEPGAADDLFVIGWQAPDEIALGELIARLSAAGVAVKPGSAEEAERRGVGKLYKLADPAGIPLELFVEPELSKLPFQSEAVRSGFVTGELGLGHVVISAHSQTESERFYTELLGFRLSDRIRCEFYGHEVDLMFLHTNRRHHSVAFGGPQRHKIHHFMLEVRALDDVGQAFDRALRKGVRIMQTLGRHPNDRMFSFYAKTPSGFQFEYGWGGREIDDASWEPTTYDRISEWGHHPPQVVFGEPRSR